MTAADPRIPAAQYFVTKGFFADYNVSLDKPRTESVRGAWENGFAKLKQRRLDPAQFALAVHAADQAESSATDETRGAFS